MSLTEDDERYEDSIQGVPSNTETSISSPSKMYTYGRELCFILALLITAYAALQKGIPKVSMSPPATPFFSETSLVADFYRGQLGPALSRVVRSDVSFIMFYAPWDAESQLVRQEFDATAKYYHREVYFAAVNCWQPDSECKRQFPNVHHFPVFIVYGLMRGSKKGLEYRGPRTMPYMVHFLKSLLYPIMRIENPSEVMESMTKYDALAVGFFNFHGPTGSKGYSIFHGAAVKHLEIHPFGNVKFAVVTNPAAMSRFGIPIANQSEDWHPVVRLFLWNETLDYNAAILNPYALNEWIDKHLHTVAIWVSPPGVKSNILAQFVDKGPVLFLFTPRNPFWEENLYFNTLREVAMEYYNCENNSRVNELMQRISVSRAESEAKYKNLAKKCAPWITKKLETIAIYQDQKANGNVLHHVCQHRNESCCCKKDDSEGTCAKLPMHLCSKTFPSLLYGACCGDRTSLCMESKGGGKSSSKLVFGDEQIFLQPFFQPRAEVQWFDERVSLLQYHEKEEKCKKLLQGELLQPAVFPNDNSSGHLLREQERLSPTIRGLACRTNRTLSLIALDSLKYHHFAVGLGVDVLSKKDATAVIILHASGETQHVMSDTFSKNSLKELIYKYSSGALRRSLRSEVVTVKKESSVLDGQKDGTCPPSSVCVLDLSSKTFKDIVLDDDKNVVVLYHSPSCAFCSSVWHIYLTVARIFTTGPNGEDISNSNITFSRIDGDANDLPWEYTMDSYPSILFFPAHRKSDSRIFPLNLPMTVSNIAQFVAANLSPEARIETLMGGCNDACLRRAKLKCLGMIASLLAKRETTETRIQHILANEERAGGLSQEEMEDFKRMLFLQHRRISLRLRHLRETYFALNKGRRKSLRSTSTSNVPDVANILSSLKRYNRALSVVNSEVFENHVSCGEVSELETEKKVGPSDRTISEDMKLPNGKQVNDATVAFKEEL